MLQAALEREAAQYCRLDRARAEAELADPEKAKEADEGQTKTLLEQMLLKMKNLREELSKNTALRDTLVAGLGEMGAAASAQLESIRYDLANLEPSSDEARALSSISSDLFVNCCIRVASSKNYGHLSMFCCSHSSLSTLAPRVKILLCRPYKVSFV